MTQLAMFEDEPEHDPGGKVKTKLAQGIKGSASFAGPMNCYRPLLQRWTGEEFPDLFVMFLGMNPSTAGPDVNDSTITREWGFTVREGYRGFVKCNVSPLRATFPKDLRKSPHALDGASNESIVRTTALRADMIIVCHGKLLKPLQPIAARIIAGLRADGMGRKMKCFGKNADGSPKHPLYLASATPLEPF